MPRRKIEEFGGDSIDQIINEMLQGQSVEEARHKRFLETRRSRNKNHMK